MIEWFIWVQIAVFLLGAVFCLVWGLLGKIPNDYTLAAGALALVLLLVQSVISILAPIFGNNPTGDLLEYWMYLITALAIAFAATAWPLFERSRWSVIVLAFALLTLAVMIWRMRVIWFIQVYTGVGS